MAGTDGRARTWPCGLGSVAPRARAVLRGPARGGGRAADRRARLPTSVVVLRQPAVYPGAVPADALSRQADRLLVLPGAARAAAPHVARDRRAGGDGPGDGDGDL